MSSTIMSTLFGPFYPVLSKALEQPGTPEGTNHTINVAILSFHESLLVIIGVVGTSSRKFPGYPHSCTTVFLLLFGSQECYQGTIVLVNNVIKSMCG